MKQILITLAFALMVGVGAPAQAADKQIDIASTIGDES
jgi:hypothetical protein